MYEYTITEHRLRQSIIYQIQSLWVRLKEITEYTRDILQHSTLLPPQHTVEWRCCSSNKDESGTIPVLQRITKIHSWSSANSDILSMGSHHAVTSPLNQASREGSWWLQHGGPNQEKPSAQSHHAVTSPLNQASREGSWWRLHGILNPMIDQAKLPCGHLST